ncbi:MAG: TonB-dependent receptor domain-containing protein [Lewinella sp.]|uniref:TonB-dependent receptor domain-containing protein n=1 Tax=Lewinella sp. TaxID=2004506 RepID=UPI003D6A6009
MKRFYQRTLLFSAFLLLGTLLMAQPPWGGGGGKKGPTIKGRITGTLVDTLSGQPVEFATLVLIQSSDGKQLDGGITEADGSFKIIEVENGAYELSISFMGYESRLVKGVETTLEKPDLDLGTVYLIPTGVNLDEIVVTEQAALVENRIDKLVYNADKDATTTGGDAADVLRNVPMLSVDLDGNVSLRGSSNIQILINGRPSTMFAANPADALKTIPANQIKTVEVITTPSAKYDGEGSSGIINIITKKRNAEGFTGSANTSIGTRQNNGGLNLNWVRGRFGLNGGANSFWSWRREGNIEFLREEYDGDLTTSVFEQKGPNSSQVLGFNGNFGAFYDFNAYNSINSSIRFNGFNNWRDGTLNGLISPTGVTESTTFARTNDNEGFRNGFDWTTDYKRTFPDSEREFSVAFQMSSTASDQENITEQTGTSAIYEEDIRNFNNGLNQEYTMQADYVHPFGEKLKLETGVKSVIRRIDSDYETLTRATNGDPFTQVSQLTDNFLYDQDVYAGYVSFNMKFGKSIGFIAGARYERTTIGGAYQELEVAPFTQEYDNLLPSFILSKQFENFSNLKVSYSQRIQRPSLFYINPFTQLNDPNNVVFGNPTLDPEVVEQYELSYGTFVKGVSVNASVYYRKTTDVIESFVQIEPSSEVSNTSYLNIGVNNSVGVNIFTSINVKKVGSFRLGFNIFTYDAASTIDSIDLSRDAIVWSTNVGANINLPRDWKFDLFGFARSPNQTLQGQNPSFWIYGMGLRKEFNKRFSLGVRAIEPFNRNKSFPSEIRGENFYQRSDFSIPFRSVGVSLSYNFGQLDFEGNGRGRRSKINNDDQKGGGSDNF